MFLQQTFESFCKHANRVNNGLLLLFFLSILLLLEIVKFCMKFQCFELHMLMKGTDLRILTFRKMRKNRLIRKGNANKKCK